jgi:hypothetical protein
MPVSKCTPYGRVGLVWMIVLVRVTDILILSWCGRWAWCKYMIMQVGWPLVNVIDIESETRKLIVR